MIHSQKIAASYHELLKIYLCECTLKTIKEIYGDNIPQDETDTIINREVKFFIWAEPQDWGFVIVPVHRNDETLYTCKEQFFNFTCKRK